MICKEYAHELAKLSRFDKSNVGNELRLIDVAIRKACVRGYMRITHYISFCTKYEDVLFIRNELLKHQYSCKIHELCESPYYKTYYLEIGWQ